MGEGYYITGVQLGLLEVVDFVERMGIIRKIEEEQFIGNADHNSRIIIRKG